MKRFYVKREILCICRVQTMFKNYWFFMGLFGPWVTPHDDQTSSKFRPKLEAFLLKNKLKISMDKAIKHIMLNAELKIQICMSEEMTAEGTSSPSLTSIHLVRWYSSPEFVKLNFDGSLTNFSPANGFITCDWTERSLKVGSAHYGVTQSPRS